MSTPTTRIAALRSSVENGRGLEPLPDRAEIGAAELLPLGEDRERVRAVERGKRRIRIADARERGERAFRRGHRNRIVRAHGCAAREQFLDQNPAWSLPHVVGVRLEREAPDGDASAGEFSPESREDLSRENALLPGV